MLRQEERVTLSLRSFGSLIRVTGKKAKIEEAQIDSILVELKQGNFQRLDEFAKLVDDLLNNILESIKAYAQRDENKKMEMIHQFLSDFFNYHLFDALDSKTIAEIRSAFDNDLSKLIADLRQEKRDERTLRHGRKPVHTIFKQMFRSNRSLDSQVMRDGKKEIGLEHEEEGVRKSLKQLLTVLAQERSGLSQSQVTALEQQARRLLLRFATIVMQEFEALHEAEVDVETQEADLIAEIKEVMKKAKGDAKVSAKLQAIISKIESHFKKDFYVARRMLGRAESLKQNVNKEFRKDEERVKPELKVVKDEGPVNPEAKLIWDFNDFMNRDFRAIAMGLTPSGHIHLGFLTTLACAFMYLKEHPGTHLIITNIENSLSSSIEKYSGVPLRFQYIEEGELLIPKDYNQLKMRNTAGRRVQGEITSLIWKLAAMFDKRTTRELKAIKEDFVPPKHKRWLEEKEHKFFHMFGNQIYVYSFMRVLEKDRAFRRNLIKYLVDIEFAAQVSQMCGTAAKWRNFGDQVVVGQKRHQAKCFQIPVRLYCPNCHQICKDWAVVVFGHPDHKGPTFAAPCKNIDGKCPRALKQPGYDGYVYRNVKEDLDMTEFHFMLDPMRDFFDPFKADCHIYGGDYFQLPNKKGITGAQKVKEMFDFLGKKTGQKKFLFGGPLITMGGEKMSKSGQAFNIKDIEDIKKVFMNTVEQLEIARSKSYPKGIQIEYTEIMKKAA